MRPHFTERFSQNRYFQNFFTVEIFSIAGQSGSGRSVSAENPRILALWQSHTFAVAK
jgi:hypothetical protein